MADAKLYDFNILLESEKRPLRQLKNDRVLIVFPNGREYLVGTKGNSLEILCRRGGGAGGDEIAVFPRCTNVIEVH